MCTHVDLTLRNGKTTSYRNMDCSLGEDGMEKCRLSDKTVAHLMASGQFTKIRIWNEFEPNGNPSYKPEMTAEEWMKSPESALREWEEKDFPAFIEKHISTAALQARHHAPEKIGIAVR